MASWNLLRRCQTSCSSALTSSLRASKVGGGFPFALLPQRCFASSPPDTKLYEWRTYHLKPDTVPQYIAMCDETAALRKKLNPALLAFFQVETGGNVNEVRHLYCFDSISHRAEIRAGGAANAEWRDFLKNSLPFVASMKSELFTSSAECHAAAESVHPQNFRPANDGPGFYEMRSYQLILGYNPVPKLYDAFASGLPAKVAADPTGGQLAFLGASEVGTLNQVVELWRYKSWEDMLTARQAARPVQAWRDTIGTVAPMVQHFDTSALKPWAFSPWQ